MFKLTGIEHKISSSYHPQTKGLDERTNQTLTRALIKFSEAKENWDENIDAALYAYRIAKQDSSQFSPFFIMYNRNPRTLQSIMNSAARQPLMSQARTHVLHI